MRNITSSHVMAMNVLSRQSRNRCDRIITSHLLRGYIIGNVDGDRQSRTMDNKRAEKPRQLAVCTEALECTGQSVLYGTVNIVRSATIVASCHTCRRHGDRELHVYESEA
ncbi:hypothetical protein J6590_029132 [Homalodisca vitripennis]|nr:hypothetical protein J6590_029132 [Homalodisca vitripennis]